MTHEEEMLRKSEAAHCRMWMWLEENSIRGDIPDLCDGGYIYVSDLKRALGENND